MENAVNFRQKINDGGYCLGAGVTFFDPTVAELLSQADMDFVWIDMEHNALTIEAVQSHIIATRASNSAAIVQEIMKPNKRRTPVNMAHPDQTEELRTTENLTQKSH